MTAAGSAVDDMDIVHLIAEIVLALMEPWLYIASCTSEETRLKHVCNNHVHHVLALRV